MRSAAFAVLAVVGLSSPSFAVENATGWGTITNPNSATCTISGSGDVLVTDGVPNTGLRWNWLCNSEGAAPPNGTRITTGRFRIVFGADTSGAGISLRATAIADLPFRPLPPNLGVLIPAVPPCACIPGFMPGLKAIHERFGTRPWGRLCEPAIHWAEEGHPVSSFEFGMLTEELRVNVYFPAGRENFTPGGFLPMVGDRFKKPELAKTLRRLAKEGPDDFITGEWARQFVAEGNRLGWPIELKHMTEVPPRWSEPHRFTHRGHEVLQLSPPDRQGVFCALVLGILRHLDLPSLGHYAKSATFQ